MNSGARSRERAFFMSFENNIGDVAESLKPLPFIMPGFENPLKPVIIAKHDAKDVTNRERTGKGWHRKRIRKTIITDTLRGLY